jgi:MFS family permease
MKQSPPFFENGSFWGLIVTQFLGAFNDNLIKQLMLLLSIPGAVAIAAGAKDGEFDLQGPATVIFGIPFVIFGGMAGFCGDRFRKSRIIVWAKVAEIFITLLGVAAFWFAPSFGYIGLFFVLFLMGTHSTFFGPGKYGIVPELLRPQDMARGNGVIMTTTFLAIIFGTYAAGWLADDLLDPNSPTKFDAMKSLWMGAIVCVAIAIVGAFTSLAVRLTPAVNPTLKLTGDAMFVPRSMIQLLRSDRPLFWALMASCAFWLIAAMAVQTINRVGSDQLDCDFKATSFLVAVISIGIAVGGVLGALLSRSRVDGRVLYSGMGLLMIFLLPLGAIDLLGWGYNIVCILLVGLGIGAALFAMPIQVILQDRPPTSLKGRMIAVMNQANFLATVISGVVFFAATLLIQSMQWKPSTIFWLMMLLFLPVVLFYRVPSELPATGSEADLEPASRSSSDAGKVTEAAAEVR